jgi:protein SCO1/2
VGNRMSRLIAMLSRFFSGAAFPVFALGVLMLYEVVLVGLMLVPPSSAGLGAYAEDFRVWCLGAEDGTGAVNWAYAAGMLSPPLFVAATIAWAWGRSLAGLRGRPGTALRPTLAAVACVVAGCALFALVGPAPASGEMTFPAESLRTHFPPPALHLVDQAGATVDLSDLRGKVVLLTGIYSRCGNTCPMIMAQAKRVVAELTPAELADVRVVAVTLDPANDSTAVLAGVARAHGLATPPWHLVTGEVSEVEATLDRMGIARVRDPKTGVIEHPNLFLVVDRAGKLAYRFTLGPRQERWLSTALRLLLREHADAS